jgi:uncharacterized protein (TIGR02145 family)
LCASFVNGTTREHYGKSKAQFCDSRDGKKYVYVTIGTQTWMAENLNYNTNTTGSKCYNNNTNCDTYGRLYNWTTAMANCPAGWHLPNNAELNVLMKFVNPSCSDNSACAGAGTKLKATSGWNTGSGYKAGTDNYGFSALPGGQGVDSFNFVGELGFWWGGASEDNANYAYYWYMSNDTEDASHTYYGKSSMYNSVRCLQD